MRRSSWMESPATFTLVGPLFLLRKLGEAVEVGFPHLHEHRLQRAQSLAVGSIQAARARSAGLHQSCLLEHPQVLRDGGPADVEMRGDLARGALGVPDQAEDLAPA